MKHLMLLAECWPAAKPGRIPLGDRPRCSPGEGRI